MQKTQSGRRSRVVIVAFVVVVIGLAATLLVVGQKNVVKTRESGLPIDCRATFGWLDRERLEPDSTGALTLPPRLESSTVDGKVWLVTRPEGRCILMKKKGEDGASAGDLCCEEPLPESAQPTPIDGRAVLSVGQGVFERLYVKQERNPHWFEVELDSQQQGAQN